MNDLRLVDFIQRYATDAPLGEGHDNAAVATPERVAAAAHEDLRLVQTTNEFYFRIYWILLLVVFLATIMVAFIYRQEMGGLPVVLGTGGVIQAGLVQRLSSEWKEKARLDIVAVLSRRLTPGQLQVILKELLPVIRK